jgi:hypothetical protein
MGFNLTDYEPVADRLERFWAEHTSGRVITTIVSRSDTDVVFRAEIWIEDRLLASGHAHETVTPRGVNSTSALENCETSAVGRALANAGYAPKGAQARPSREEMAKVERRSRNAVDAADRARIEHCKKLLISDDDKAWAKKSFKWPWSDSACDTIEARFQSAYKPGEEPF